MNPSESIEAFTKAIELIKYAKLPKDQKRNNIEELKINIKNANKIPQFTEEIVHDPTLDIVEEHAEIEGFSKKLGVKFTDDKGRFAVANEIIEPGEVICKTKPVASIILFNDSLEYCYNCLSHVISPIPCTKCASAVFCSFICLKDSLDRHVYDCPLSFMDIYLSKGLWVCNFILF